MNDFIKHKDSFKYILIAFSLTMFLMLIQASAAFYSNSLALWADSSHLLVHNSSLLIALFSSMASFILSKKNHNTALLIDIIGGLINCIIFLSLAYFIFSKGLHRIHSNHNHEINSTIMTIVSILGFIIHSLSAYVLSKGKKHSFNVQALFLHTFIDCLSTILTFSAGIIITFTEFIHADTFASMIISCLIAFSGTRLLKKCIKKLKSIKKSFKLNKEITAYLIKTYKEIKNIHNSEVIFENKSLTYATHFILKEKNNLDLEEIKKDLKEKFNISHFIFQIER